MAYKLNHYDGASFVNLLQDLYVEIDNTNWNSTSLSAFLDEISTSIDGKKDRTVVKTAVDVGSTAGDIILVDTADYVTVTLPSSPTQGDEVYIVDTVGNAENKEITLDGNGSSINGQALDLIMDVDLNSVKLIFDNATNGWFIDMGGSFIGRDASEINSAYVTLNADFTTGTPTENGGLIMSRGSSDDVVIRWNETTDKWELTNDGTTFSEIQTAGSIALMDHGSLSGLGDDDHTQYMHNTEDRTVTATHTFNPDVQGVPFVIGANATKQLVSGLNSEFTNDILPSSLTAEPSVMTAGDFWFEEVENSVDRSTPALAAASPNLTYTQFDATATIAFPATTEYYGIKIIAGTGTHGNVKFTDPNNTLDWYIYSDAGTTLVDSNTVGANTFFMSGLYIAQDMWLVVRQHLTSNAMDATLLTQEQ